MKVFNDFDLTDHNSYRIKAVCRTAYFPESDEDVMDLFQKGGSDKIVLGGGYNVLLSKDRYDDDFVIFSADYGQLELVSDDMVLCHAGCDMKVISEFALEHSLTGVEIYYDIPSSLGGAVVMNAGAGGEDIKALLVSVDYFDPDKGQICTISKDEIGFEYRNSFFQKNPQMIVCRALLKLKKGDRNAIKQKMDDTKDARWAKQPRDLPNAGSVFKRPPGKFVGPMIEELGLKGYAIGGAKISEKHAGFIVNFNNARGSDIVELINKVKEAVAARFQVDLEIEQRII